MKKRASKGTIKIDLKRCKGCGLCTSVCPAASIRLADQVDHFAARIASFDAAGNCSACAFCAIICPDVAIEVFRKGLPEPQRFDAQ